MSIQSEAYNYFKNIEEYNGIKSDITIRKRVANILGFRDYIQAKEIYAEPIVEAYNKLMAKQEAEKENVNKQVIIEETPEKESVDKKDLKITMICRIEDTRYRQLLRLINF